MGTPWPCLNPTAVTAAHTARCFVSFIPFIAFIAPRCTPTHSPSPMVLSTAVRGRTGTLDEFKQEVEAEREILKARHAQEQRDFKRQVLGYTYQNDKGEYIDVAGAIPNVASLTANVSDEVKEMRSTVASLVREQKWDEARAKKAELDKQSIAELKVNSGPPHPSVRCGR